MDYLMVVLELEEVKEEKVLMEGQWMEVEGRVFFLGAVEAN